jgi:hypothetical protein
MPAQKSRTAAARIPLFHPLPKGATAFRPEFIDFKRGIRVGHLEDNERITRLLKIGLEHKHQQSFVTERYGRGMYWQWIGFLSRANRAAKPISSHVSFGCSKYFLTVDTSENIFKCGLQIERGYVKASPDSSKFELAADWDWHRLVKSLKPGGPLAAELDRLIRDDGFAIFAGSWESEGAAFSRQNPLDVAKLKKALKSAPAHQWAGFQLYYPMSGREVRESTGIDFIESILAIFDEVTPAMNFSMQVPL